MQSFIPTIFISCCMSFSLTNPSLCCYLLTIKKQTLVDVEENKPANETRQLGLIVCRGPAVILISPVDGSEEIANPFLQQ